MSETFPKVVVSRHHIMIMYHNYEERKAKSDMVTNNLIASIAPQGEIVEGRKNTEILACNHVTTSPFAALLTPDRIPIPVHTDQSARRPRPQQQKSNSQQVAVLVKVNC